MAVRLGPSREIRTPHYLIVTAFAIAILLVTQFKALVTITNNGRHIEDREKNFVGTSIPRDVKMPDNQYDQKVSESIGPITTINSNSSVSCDSSPCNGFFAYNGPNKDKKAALDVLQKAVAVYHYGNERNSETENIMIFMPKITNHPSCVLEWKESRSKWVDRGMSANAEDITIYDAFFSSSEFRGGNRTYLEIGAHDGVRESNSRFYDICLGWNGLLVEPHPQNYERTVQLRPNAHHLGIAPSCMANESGTVLFPERIYTSAQVNEENSKIQIHCGPLQYYLDALEIRHIDFWSLDVEGSELKVLETVDFHRTHMMSSLRNQKIGLVICRKSRRKWRM